MVHVTHVFITKIENIVVKMDNNVIAVAIVVAIVVVVVELKHQM